MIFVTVGAQTSFDRLVLTMDEWAASEHREDVEAQIGPGEYIPRHLRWSRFMPPREFREKMAQARGVVAHAGVGTVLTALDLRKPLLVLPRESARGETRSNHQVATARYFQEQGLLLAAFSEKELVEKIALLESPDARPPIRSEASETLLARIREFSAGEPCPEREPEC